MCWCECVFLCIPAAGLVNGSVSLRCLVKRTSSSSSFFSFCECFAAFQHVSVSLFPFEGVFNFSYQPLHNTVSAVLKSSATIYVHKHYVYICKIGFASSVVLNTLNWSRLFICIKFVADDNCKFVSQHVTLKLKINIVLPHFCLMRGFLEKTRVVQIWAESSRSQNGDS